MNIEKPRLPRQRTRRGVAGYRGEAKGLVEIIDETKPAEVKAVIHTPRVEVETGPTIGELRARAKALGGWIQGRPHAAHQRGRGELT